MDELLRQLTRKALTGDLEATYQLYENMRRCNQIVSQKVSYFTEHGIGSLEIVLVAPERYLYDAHLKSGELLMQLIWQSKYPHGSTRASTPARWNTITSDWTEDFSTNSIMLTARKWLLEHPQEVADALKITKQQVLFDAHRRYLKAEQDLNEIREYLLKSLTSVLNDK